MNRPRRILLVKTYDEQKHPRLPKGRQDAKYRPGEFVPKGAGGEPVREANTVKPQLQADVSRLWEIETVKTYQSRNYPALMVREAIQNARDAIRAAIKAGQIAPGEGRIEVRVNPHTKSITVTDNGIGMDWDTLQSKFLTLGGTGKENDPDAGGGYGMAKAIILGSSENFDWEIHTRDNYLRSDQLGKEADISEFKTTPRQGTSITVKGIKHWDTDDRSGWFAGEGATERALTELLQLSTSPRGEYRVTLDEHPIRDPYEGMRGQNFSEFADWGSPHTSATVKAYRRSGTGKTRIVVRLKGLYQWAEFVGQETTNPRDVIVSLETTARPNSPEYPFTAGRDGFNWRSTAYSRMSELKDYLSREVYSSNREMEWEDIYLDRPKEHQRLGEPLTPMQQIQAQLGTMAQGGKVTVSDSPDGTTDRSEERDDPFAGALGGTSSQEGTRGQMRVESKTVSRTKAREEKAIQLTAQVMGRIAPVLADFPYTSADLPWYISRNRKSTEHLGKKPDTLQYMPLLVVWDAISHLVAQEYGMMRIAPSNFGTGLVLDPNVRAQAVSDPHSQGQYVQIEPIGATAALEKAKQKGNAWLFTNYLYGLACHELAHIPLSGQGHSEQFTVQREDIQLETGHLLPVLNRVVEAAFFEGKPVRVPAARPQDEAKYEQVKAAARERAAAYHARQKALKEVARAFGFDKAEHLMDQIYWRDKSEIARMTPDEIREDLAREIGSRVSVRGERY